MDMRKEEHVAGAHLIPATTHTVILGSCSEEEQEKYLQVWKTDQRRLVFLPSCSLRVSEEYPDVVFTSAQPASVAQAAGWRNEIIPLCF